MKKSKITSRGTAMALGLFLPCTLAQAANLIDQWNFNESSGTTASNEVSGGASATLMGNASFDGVGSVSLNGTSGTYIDLGSSLLAGLTSVTLEGWFSYSVPNDNVHLFSIDDGTGTGTQNGGAWNGNYIRYNINAGVGTVEIPNLGNPHNTGAAGDGKVVGPTTLSQNTLHQVVFVYDPATGVESLYLDGALEATVSGAVAPLSSVFQSRFALGASPWSNFGDPFLNGKIDQFRIYDGALTGTEVAANFAARPVAAHPADSDGDGLPDYWEIAHGLDPNDNGSINPDNGASGDPDFDSVSNAYEYAAGSDPQNPASVPGDVDGDGLPDSWELSNFGNLSANPYEDPDGDYGYNIDEYNDGTNPKDRLSTLDVDGGTPDGMGDYWETFFFGDTTRGGAGDYDLDGVSDLQEWQNHSDPTNSKDPFAGTAAVTWSTPTTIIADTDIDLTGVFLHAGNFRSDNADYTVTVSAQPILFKNRASRNTSGTLEVGEEAAVIDGSGNRAVAGSFFDATGTTVSANFEAVLDGFAWEDNDAGPAPGATDMILRVTGPNGVPLTEGDQYRIQLFYSDDRAASNARGQLYHDGLGNSSDVVISGNSTSVIGTFTASADGYQDIFIQNTTGGSNFPLAINAYVLRTVPSSNDTDSDSDGMDDTWETTYFGNLSQTATGDFDGDGTDNLTEYRLGLIPNNGGSRFAVTTTDNTLGDGYTIAWQGKAGLAFTVERSTTLAAASWTKLTPNPQTGVDGTNSFTDPAPVPAGKAFYRVLLEP